MSFPTSRRHPRTLAEAWPREHANPVEFYPSPLRIRAANALRWAALAGGLALIFFLVYERL